MLSTKVDDKDIFQLKEKIAELPTVKQNLELKQDVKEKINDFRKDNIDVKKTVIEFN